MCYHCTTRSCWTSGLSKYEEMKGPTLKLRNTPEYVPVILNLMRCTQHLQVCKVQTGAVPTEFTWGRAKERRLLVRKPVSTTPNMEEPMDQTEPSSHLTTSVQTSFWAKLNRWKNSSAKKRKEVTFSEMKGIMFDLSWHHSHPMRGIFALKCSQRVTQTCVFIQGSPLIMHFNNVIIYWTLKTT